MNIYNATTMCGGVASITSNFFYNKTPDWFNSEMGQFFADSELKINRTALLIAETKALSFCQKQPSTDLLMLGGLSAIMLVACTSKVQGKKYQEAAKIICHAGLGLLAVAFLAPIKSDLCMHVVKPLFYLMNK